MSVIQELDETIAQLREDAREMAQALKIIADYLPSEELRYQLLQETASSAERSNKKMKWNLMITAQRAFEKHGAKYLEQP